HLGLPDTAPSLVVLGLDPRTREGCRAKEGLFLFIVRIETARPNRKAEHQGRLSRSASCVSISSGRQVSTSAFAGERAICAPILRAATTAPDALRSGTAIEHRPFSSSWSITA